MVSTGEVSESGLFEELRDDDEILAVQRSRLPIGPAAKSRLLI